MAYRTTGQLAELQENAGVPLRQPATALLTVDTRDGIIQNAQGFIVNAFNTNDIYINKQQPIGRGYLTRVALTELNLNWNTPNVIGTLPWANNTLTLELGSGLGAGVVVASKTITILENFYSPKILAKAVQDALNAGLGTFGSTAWVVLYNDKFASFQIQDTTATAPFRVVPKNQGNSDDLCNLMGLTGAIQTFHYILNGGFATMCYTPYVDIESEQLTKKQNISDNSTNNVTGQNLLARVYLNRENYATRTDNSTVTVPQVIDTEIIGCRPFTLNKQFQTPKQIYWDAKEFINVVDIALRDYKGRVLYAPADPGPGFVPDPAVGNCANTTYYQLTLQITET
jgi:hypothetical protein